MHLWEGVRCPPWPYCNSSYHAQLHPITAKYPLPADTVEERNRLMRDVYPSLRTYCQQRGLEFQVVDMRWGVRDETTADHKTNEICVQEIKNCQRLTPGPNFVVNMCESYYETISFSPK